MKASLGIYKFDGYPIDGTIQEQNEFVRERFELGFIHLKNDKDEVHIIPYIEVSREVEQVELPDDLTQEHIENILND